MNDELKDELKNAGQKLQDSEVLGDELLKDATGGSKEMRNNVISKNSDQVKCDLLKNDNNANSSTKKKTWKSSNNAMQETEISVAE